MKKEDFKELCWSAKARVVMADLRLIPRGIILFYFATLWYVVEWFMGLAEPSTQHASLVTVYAGVLPAVLGAYSSTGNKKLED